MDALKGLFVKKAAKAAALICRQGCLGNFDSCSRCTGKSRIGIMESCPLEVYGVKPQTASLTGPRASEEDCFFLCLACEHTKVVEDDSGFYIVNDDEICFEYCVDCPVEMRLQDIEENFAEARASMD